jgi:hypothetical protein
VDRLARYIHHSDANVRATAIDRVGRLRIIELQPTIRKFLADQDELPSVRAASAFALTLLGDPACFGDLAEASREPENIGRWARRGCFMLLARVDLEHREWFLEMSQIESSIALDDLLAQIRADIGTNSQRLAKALVLEKLVNEEWSTECLDLLAFVVYEVGRTLQTSYYRIKDYPSILKAAGSFLGVAPGDLRHSFLSFTFIRSVWSSGWPSGLEEMFSEQWNCLKNEHDSFLTKIKAKWDLRRITEHLEIP